MRSPWPPPPPTSRARTSSTHAGQPATGLASVTDIGPDLTWADTFATAVFVMGLDGLPWLSRHPGYGAYVITPDGIAHFTPTFARHRATD